MLLAGRGCAEGQADLDGAAAAFGAAAAQGFYRGMLGMARVSMLRDAPQVSYSYP